MEKVIIKSTGEILDVVSKYTMVKMTIELPIDFPDKEKFEKEISETCTYELKCETSKDKEDFYILSNGKTYEVDDLVVGLDEIRNWKLESGLDI